MIGALIGAGTSLLGGLFGKKSEKKAIAAQNAYNDPSAVRARAENAGFNPLLFVGPGVGQQTTTGGTNYMGSAIADAGMIVADGLAKKKESALVSALQKQNKAQSDKIIALTLRPKVGGIYERRMSVPTTRQALGLPHETTAPLGFNIADHSANPAPLVGQPSDDLTGVQLATKQDVPAFRAFGHDFYGSGNFSTGQQIEDSVGEGPGTWVASPFIYGDAFWNEASKAYKKKQSQRASGNAKRFRPMPPVGKVLRPGMFKNTGPFPGYPMLRP